MDYRKTNAPSNTVTRDMMKLSSDTGNVYETVAIIGKRANQIAVEMLIVNCQLFYYVTENTNGLFAYYNGIDDCHSVFTACRVAVG